MAYHLICILGPIAVFLILLPALKSVERKPIDNCSVCLKEIKNDSDISPLGEYGQLVCLDCARGWKRWFKPHNTNRGDV